MGELRGGTGESIEGIGGRWGRRCWLVDWSEVFPVLMLVVNRQNLTLFRFEWPTDVMIDSLACEQNMLKGHLPRDVYRRVRVYAEYGCDVPTSGAASYLFTFILNLELSDTTSMSLQYEPALEPLHISLKQSFAGL